MSKTTSLLLVLIPTSLAACLTLGALAAKASGVISGEFLIPNRVTDTFPSCGQCHATKPNANGKVAVEITTASLSVATGAKMPVSVKVTGGPGKNLGGFSMETNGGMFVSTDANTRTTQSGNAVTHTNKFGNSWTFEFRAPPSPGPVSWTAVGNSVNADNGTTGDSWGFWGPDSSVPGVPFRLFVNAPHVDGYGTGCMGTDGHVPILGARKPAAVGQPFIAECHNVVPQAAVLHVFGLSDKSYGPLPLPFDLRPLGASGCFLRADHVLLQVAPAGGQGSGGGRADGQWAFPNDAQLKGLAVFFQALAVDAQANALGLTTSNGLKAVLQ